MPLDFEIYGGQDEKSIDGNTGIFIKKIKEGSTLHPTVKIGDHILKVCEKKFKEYNTCRMLFPDGLIAQMVEHCTDIAEIMGWNPVQP